MSVTPTRLACTNKLPQTLTMESLTQEVIFAEITQGSLKTLQLLSQEVFFPLIKNPENRQEWSGPTSKEIMSKINNFLSTLYVTVGQAEGRTLLPLPPDEVGAYAQRWFSSF